MHEARITSGRGIQLRCGVTTSRSERRRGLSRRAGLQPAEAMLFPNATSVHTFGVRFPILVARLDDAMTVLDVRRVPPRRLVRPMRRARHVLECNMDVDLRRGDVLRLEVPSLRSADDDPDQREYKHRREGQGDDDDRHQAPSPRGEGHGLAAGGVRLDEPEELQQRPHR
jgi:uncharacterized membrane protein (UPF0127 family)